METVFLVIAIVCMVVGFIGCIVPALPGVPVAYAGLLFAHFSGYATFPLWALIMWGVFTIVLLILDYIIPAWGTKQFGGTKWGVWGSTLGLIVGLFIPPFGFIIGPFVGAFIFESLRGASSKDAFNAAFGSLVGLLTGTFLKLLCCLAMCIHMVWAMC